jgi:hypothetical protein
MTTFLPMEAAIQDFPFVRSLPKRKQSVIGQAWRALQDFRRLTDEHGGLFPPAAAQGFLGVSKQRISQLCQAGKLETLQAYGRIYITGNSIEVWAKEERDPGGRPKTN